LIAFSCAYWKEKISDGRDFKKNREVVTKWVKGSQLSGGMGPPRMNIER